jgi:hypothetical protein
MQSVSHDRRCPICGEANDCRIANGCTYKSACWCEAAIIPVSLQHYLANEFSERSCFCRDCLSLLARHAIQMDVADLIVARVRTERTSLRENIDSYVDAQGRTIFTAAFHLKRGYCCGNGCRHCPFVGSKTTHESST